MKKKCEKRLKKRKDLDRKSEIIKKSPETVT
jgi:hypothetical protein